MKKIIFSIFTILFIKTPVLASGFPVTIDSCGRNVVFESAPKRMITHDINITEIVLSLDLQSKLIGVTGISGWNKFTPEFQNKIGSNVKELSKKYPSMEVILNANPDFVFAGWNYGFKQSSDFNPRQLSKFGIKSYELRESCVHAGTKQSPASINDLYHDTLAIGYIFGVGERAEKLVASYKKQLAKIIASTPKTKAKVFVFDDIADSPFTAGGYGMPSALIKSAGGINVMEPINKSWTRVTWESVAKANPDAYIIVNYGANTAEEKISYLKKLPAIAHTAGIINNKFIILDYNEVTPSPRNIGAVKKIANVLRTIK